ncbi:hypothetical protein [Actinomadura roseirufa]|uniref:hypothetical protein n=1 Tax=Actinomadura roseirufa TaxID=2094049 RepID=UPI001041A049|nr:hypothetical protein [Actinomadura roseirufa]
MIGGNVLEEAAKAFQEAVGWLVSNTASWWVRTPSPNLETEPAIGYLQLLVRPLTVAVAVLALLLVAGRTVLTRKAVPLIDAGRGLVALAAVGAIGVALPNLLLEWGDQWCGWVLPAASHGGFAKRMTALVTLPTGTPAALVIVLCLAALMIGIIQALLLLFRGAALIILAALLPLAAAGMITSATRSWFTRITGWMLALIFYKPAAAAVYATAFTLIGHGKDLHAVLMGFAMMLISLIAFPVLLKFFTWTTGGTESSSGGGVLGALMGGATALGVLRASQGAADGRSTSAGEHATYLDQQLGDRQPSPKDADSSPPMDPPPGGGPSSGQATDPARPTGSQQTSSDSHEPSPHQSGQGSTAPDSAEPVGPTVMGTWEKERHRGEDTLRWMGNPSGSTDAGGPSGAGGEGGGGGGA